MSGLTEAIRRCKVRLKLDNNTEGYGNCFPNAIVQQCRRPEINNILREKNPRGIFKSPQALRREITKFALNDNHKTMNEYKTNYETALYNTDRTWVDYWVNMGKDGTWVDSVFIQVTAWYIGLDIQILTTASMPDNPFIVISGNFSNPLVNSGGPPILIGNYTNVHYQSLLPTRNNLETKEIKPIQEKEQESVLIQDNFVYSYEGVQIIFPQIEETKFQCPFCNRCFSRIMSHVSSQQCTISESMIDTAEFASQFNAFKEGFRLEMGKRRKQKSRAKLIDERGKEAIKKDENERKSKRRAEIKEKRGEDAVKKDQNRIKSSSDAKIKEEKGIETFKKVANDRKMKSRNKMRVEKGPIRIRKEQNAFECLSRKRKMESDPMRLKSDEIKRKKLSRTK